jgi:hypothetical protein
LTQRSRRGRFAAGAIAALLVATGQAAAPARASVDLNPVVRWNRILLRTIRTTATPPTVAARALAVLHTCVYDAWAAYDPVAVGTRLGAALRQPPEERTLDAKREAISRAARLAAADLYPQFAARFDGELAEEGYDPSPAAASAAAAEGSPAAVAEQACGAAVGHRQRDGANQLGDEPGSAGGPYSDWTGYQPVNGPDAVRDPDRWQPLRTADGRVQQFVTPHWERVSPFAGDDPGIDVDPGPPAAGTPVRQAEIDEIVALSAGLTDEQKVIAEYWADGPGSESPPGHWMLFGELCSRRDAHGLDSDVKLFFVLSNAMLDASIATWKRKRQFDSIRPVSLVRSVLAGRTVRAWGGPHQGTRVIDGSQWRPYIATPPFPEYTSGHSAFSAAGAEALRLFTGRDDLDASVVIPAGSSRVEPGTVPARAVVLRWSTFSEAADQAGFSRRLGGIHFASGDVNGRLLGRRVAARVVATAQQYFTGLVRAPVTTPGSS